MVVVSENMIVYKLNKTLVAEKIIESINKLIQDNTDDLENKLLIIDIKKIISDDASHIPKLEYKKEET